MSPNFRRTVATVMVVLVATVAVACSGEGSKVAKAPEPGAATTTTQRHALRVLVTNDDGVGAPGIDAVVEALRAVPDTEVTVVAPATNQSGTGGRTTAGTLTVTDATTASGFAAKAVAGYPADTIIWAVDHKGIGFTPDLVVSGINLGQNVGALADISGTVGAAKAAGARGIPALAASQGITAGASGPDFPSGVKQVLDWVAANRKALPKRVLNLNIPTCVTGTVRGVATVPKAPQDSRKLTSVDCLSTKTTFVDDVDAFVNGYAAIAVVPAD